MYIHTVECAEFLKVSVRRVQTLLTQNRIQGAFKENGRWKIPLFDGRPIVSRGQRGPLARWCFISIYNEEIEKILLQD